jgi:hypothetical protein
MQRLEVNGAVRHIYISLGVKGLNIATSTVHILEKFKVALVVTKCIRLHIIQVLIPALSKPRHWILH